MSEDEAGIDRQDKDRGIIYHKPKGSETEFSFSMAEDRSMHYIAHADFIILQKEEKPVAEMFHVFYEKKEEQSKERPITFLFNGGPGAASAFLHLGAVGPKRVLMNNDGSAPSPPVRLVNNESTWLTFTDLVFIDPVGTGFSRVIPKAPNFNRQLTEDQSIKNSETDNKEFYKLNRDLESLGEFIQKFLSKHNRWDSPIFIAGESYGGFRVAKLSKLLHQGFGVGLNGAILISPALEISLLNRSDYDILTWSDVFPSMAAISAFHGKSHLFSPETPVEKVILKAESFTNQNMVRLLAHANGIEEKEKTQLISEMADFLGISEGFIRLSNCRITPEKFSREILKEKKRVCGLYDGSVTAPDPYPDREVYEGPDLTLYGIERIFNAGINTHLRKNLNVKTDRDYILMSEEVSEMWKNDAQKSAFETQIGAMDELVYGMVLNPHMNIFISHGYYDMITPYYSSNRMIGLLKIEKEIKAHIQLKHFRGGHMFYTWESSRIEFTSTMMQFYKDSCPVIPLK